MEGAQPCRPDMSILLAPADPWPFELVNPDGRSPIVLTCEHAGRRLPLGLGTLGLENSVFDSHVAWDPGAYEIACLVSAGLDAAMIAQPYSRLVIDCNRATHAPDLIVEQSHGVEVPGNRALDPAARNARIGEIFDPYHAAIARALDARLERDRNAAVISIHTFSPSLGGAGRPWEIGVVSGPDRRIADPLIDALRRDGVVVGDNEPYRLEDTDGTQMIHGMSRGLPNALIEVRQDIAGAPASRSHLAGRLAEILAEYGFASLRTM